MDLDNLPRKNLEILIGENLEAISLAELAQRIEALESEISRTRAEMVRKQQSRSAADAFFSAKS